MSNPPLDVEIRSNGHKVLHLTITKVTDNETGTGTYEWVYIRHDLGPLNGLLSAQRGTVGHVREDGAMALISKVANLASETEV